ncbi:Signal transduction histidine kinase [Spirosomataceae bacterium TFI 002]|nr:Signal transduction histidine kinase [Spirosomataceae bacterium TFI 002]
MNQRLSKTARLSYSSMMFNLLIVVFNLISLSSFSQPPSGNAEIDRLNKLAYKLVYDEAKADSLFLVATQMKTLGENKNNEIGLLYGLRFGGLALSNNGKYEESLKEVFLFLDLAKKLDLSEEQLKAYGDMGNIYMQTNRIQEAKTIYLEPTRNEVLIKANPKRASAFFTNLGVVYKRENKLDSALMMYKKSVELKSIANDTLGMLGVNTNIATLYGDLGELRKAKVLFKENIAIARKIKNKGDFWHNLAGLGRLLIQSGDLEESLKMLNEALSVAIEIESKNFQFQSLDLIALNYEKSKQFEKAHEYYKKAREISESLLNENTNNAVSKLREEFNAEEREKENKLLSQELEIQKTRQVLLGGGLGIAALVGLLAFFAWRKNEKKNRQIEIQKNEIELLNTSLEKKVEKRTSELMLALEEVKDASHKGEQKERKRLASDLHDNLGSVLSAISMHLEALDPKSLTAGENKLYANIKSMTSDAYNEIRLISHNLSPKELEKEGGLAKAMERLVLKLNAAKKTNFKMNFSLKHRLPQRMEVNIYAIVLELTNNVLRHAKAKNAEISLKGEGDLLRLIVTDDGTGFVNNNSTGLGLNSIQVRVEELNGNLKIDNDKGGHVEIEIPLT